MAKLHSVAALAAAFTARFPNAGLAQGGTVESISASADAGTLPSVQAMAVKGFSAISGKLVYVRAKHHFYVGFEIINAGDYVQVPEDEAKRLVNVGRAELATDEEVTKAQKAAK